MIVQYAKNGKHGYVCLTLHYMKYESLVYICDDVETGTDSTSRS